MLGADLPGGLPLGHMRQPVFGRGLAAAKHFRSLQQGQPLRGGQRVERQRRHLVNGGVQPVEGRGDGLRSDPPLEDMFERYRRPPTKPDAIPSVKPT
jgi:hypothetical protein